MLGLSGACPGSDPQAYQIVRTTPLSWIRVSEVTRDIRPTMAVAAMIRSKGSAGKLEGRNAATAAISVVTSRTPRPTSATRRRSHCVGVCWILIRPEASELGQLHQRDGGNSQLPPPALPSRSPVGRVARAFRSANQPHHRLRVEQDHRASGRPMRPALARQRALAHARLPSRDRDVLLGLLFRRLPLCGPLPLELLPLLLGPEGLLDVAHDLHLVGHAAEDALLRGGSAGTSLATGLPCLVMT